MGKTKTRKPKKGLTFEDVWAMFQETDRMSKETDRKLKEVTEQFKETAPPSAFATSAAETNILLLRRWKFFTAHITESRSAAG